jgi:ribosomal-protein-alanine N-acetyltransferase
MRQKRGGAGNRVPLGTAIGLSQCYGGGNALKWVRIRSATEEDIDAIMELEEICFTLPWLREDYERDIGSNILSYYIVAETKNHDDAVEVRTKGVDEGCAVVVDAMTEGTGKKCAGGNRRAACRNIVAGYGGIWVVEDECHIMTIAVAPGHRQAGIGAMMLMKLMDEARLRGARRYFLEVRVSNEAATSMYEKFGFQTIDIRKAYYEDDKEDAAIMYREDRA